MSKKTENKKEMVKSFTILKGSINYLLNWITYVLARDENGVMKKVKGANGQLQLPAWFLHGAEARARNRIHKILAERGDEVEKERMELVKKYAKVDPKTKELVTIDNIYDFGDKYKEFEKEFNILMDEKTTFDILPSNSSDWNTVKDLFINKLKSNLSVEETQIYEDLCIAFEAI